MVTRTEEAKVELNQFVVELPNKTDTELRELAREYIWLSAYATNNPHSNFHGKCDAVHKECVRRDKESIYGQTHEQLMREARGY